MCYRNSNFGLRSYFRADGQFHSFASSPCCIFVIGELDVYKVTLLTYRLTVHCTAQTTEHSRNSKLLRIRVRGNVSPHTSARTAASTDFLYGNVLPLETNEVGAVVVTAINPQLLISAA